MRAVCVYCGSSSGVGDSYLKAAEALGRALAERCMTLVYGGASIGVMGRIADSVLASGGRVIGVIPHALADLEIAHQNLTELVQVEDMHARKYRMASEADGFIALPGGLGTLEELFEVWTWSQLDIHRKPVGVLNVGGFYDRLIDMVEWHSTQGFVKPAHRDLLLARSDASELLEVMSSWQPQVASKL